MISTRIVFDHRNRTKAGTEGPVELRVQFDSKTYYFNTGIKVRGRELRNGVIINRNDVTVLNQQLQLIVQRIEKEFVSCIEHNIPIDVAEIRRRAYNINKVGEENKDDMLNWMLEQIPLLKIKSGTRQRYEVTMRRLKSYGKMTSWADLTLENLYKWDKYLHTIKRPQSNGEIQAKAKPECIGESAVYNYHRTLQTLIVRAVKFGIIDSNPYERARGEFRKGIKENIEYLNEEEIEAIESLHPLPGTQMAMARDLFVFQLYTGLSYSDAQAFDISDYKKVRGKWVNVGERIKTGVPYVSQLLPQAIEVLERYSMQVPKVANAQYNESLKVIQKALGIRTKLHSHLARHTFATRMLSLGVKIENVSRMLGHTNIVQTQRYAKVLAKDVRSEFDMVEEKLRKK